MRSIAPAWLAPLLVGSLLVACSGPSERAAPAEDVSADLRVILTTMIEDPARSPLEEVDEAFRDERPVLAADLIEQGAKPATERQLRALRALSLTSAEGRRLRARAVRLYQARFDALELLRGALSRGIGQEDEHLVAAMHADARAQIALVELEDELRRRVPDLDDARSLEPHGPVTPLTPSGDEPLAPRPEHPNEAASDPLDPPDPE